MDEPRSRNSSLASCPSPHALISLSVASYSFPTVKTTLYPIEALVLVLLLGWFRTRFNVQLRLVTGPRPPCAVLEGLDRAGILTRISVLHSETFLRGTRSSPVLRLRLGSLSSLFAPDQPRGSKCYGVQCAIPLSSSFYTLPLPPRLSLSKPPSISLPRLDLVPCRPTLFARIGLTTGTRSPSSETGSMLSLTVAELTRPSRCSARSTNGTATK